MLRAAAAEPPGHAPKRASGQAALWGLQGGRSRKAVLLAVSVLAATLTLLAAIGTLLAAILTIEWRFGVILGESMKIVRFWVKK